MYKIGMRGGGSENRSLGQTLFLYEISKCIMICYINYLYYLFQLKYDVNLCPTFYWENQEIKFDEKLILTIMAVLGIQFVITMMMATVLSRVGPHLSLARWLLSSRFDIDSDLNKLEGFYAITEFIGELDGFEIRFD